ncbi:MAG TPA: DUF2817 domain-containing protein [Candidatus Saccharimonadales bacterium]|jgi:protein MpaA
MDPGNVQQSPIEQQPRQTMASSFVAHVKSLSRKLPGRRKSAIIFGIVFAVLAAVYVLQFYVPKTVAFSYSSQSCTFLPQFLPSTTRQQPSRSFRLDSVPTVSIGKTVLFARTACLRAVNIPQQNSQQQIKLALPGIPALRKTVSVSTGSYPALSRSVTPGQLISTKDPLRFTINQADRVFTYHISTITESKAVRAECPQKDNALLCDLPSLRLTQGARYDVAIERHYAGRPAGTALRQSIQIVEPLQVVSSSITGGQTVYSIPTEITLTLNKPANNYKNVTLKTTTGPALTIKATPTFKDKVVTFKLEQPLPRSVSLQLSVENITSADGGYLAAPYTLAFATSGGPKVQSVNIGSYKISSGQPIVLTFDSPIGAGQNLNDFIKIESGGNVSAAISASGNSITIRPASLAPCSGFTVKVLDGLKNEHGVVGGSAWQYASRITCQQVFSIGTSTAGRGITAYRFGNGDNKIVYVGGTHGNEKSSVTILNRWIEQLEAQSSRIPARTSIIVIPALNPDGYAANSRTNASNVDLNRNFPANNWKSGVTLPNKTFLPAGGGSAPLSEPESRAIADYLVAQRPRLVLTYHASGNIVIPNDAGDSVAVARQYADKSSVYFSANAQTGAIFDYDTTGAMEDWLYDKLGITTLLIELLSQTSNDYNNHQNAMWWTAGL